MAAARPMRLAIRWGSTDNRLAGWIAEFSELVAELGELFDVPGALVGEALFAVGAFHRGRRKLPALLHRLELPKLVTPCVQDSAPPGMPATNR